MGYIGSWNAADKLPQSKVLLGKNLVANVTTGICFGRLINQLDEQPRGGERVLNCRQAPCVKVAQTMNTLDRAVLNAICLILLQKSTEGASWFLKNFENRLVDDKRSVCPHQMISAITEPHHTATSPRTRLLTAYRAPRKKAPVRIVERVSHSYVENVLYAPIKPTGTKNLQARFRSARLASRVSENTFCPKNCGQSE